MYSDLNTPSPKKFEKKGAGRCGHKINISHKEKPRRQAGFGPQWQADVGTTAAGALQMLRRCQGGGTLEQFSTN